MTWIQAALVAVGFILGFALRRYLRRRRDERLRQFRRLLLILTARARMGA